MINLIHGDCLEEIKKIPKNSYNCVITDPVWPNSLSLLSGYKNPYQLFRAAARLFCPIERLIVHLGCSSDPRFLSVVPKKMKFLRVCWLRYSFPSYRGRLLIGSDVAYIFGTPAKSRKGYHLLPGECNFKKSETMIIKIKGRKHPTPRKIEHLKWLINKMTAPDDTILDPFMGSGTTGVACKELNRNFIGIEINKDYYEIAKKRIANTQESMF